ncbi:unnamed protein product [Ixodes pacificus]
MPCDELASLTSSPVTSWPVTTGLVTSSPRPLRRTHRVSRIEKTSTQEEKKKRRKQDAATFPRKMIQDSAPAIFESFFSNVLYLL